MDIEAVVFVPGKIIAGICFTDQKVENQFPHVTLLINGWKPVESNTTLNTLFDKQHGIDPGLYFKLRKGSLKLPFSKRFTIPSKDGEQKCYLVAGEQALKLQGITRAFY